MQGIIMTNEGQLRPDEGKSGNAGKCCHQNTKLDLRGCVHITSGGLSKITEPCKPPLMAQWQYFESFWKLYMNSIINTVLGKSLQPSFFVFCLENWEIGAIMHWNIWTYMEIQYKRHKWSKIIPEGQLLIDRAVHQNSTIGQTRELSGLTTGKPVSQCSTHGYWSAFHCTDDICLEVTGGQLLTHECRLHKDDDCSCCCSAYRSAQH